MLRDLINIDRNELSEEMLRIYFVKRYVTKNSIQETFLIRNSVVLLIKSGSFKMRIKEMSADLKAHDLLVLPKNISLSMVEAGDKLQFFLINFSSHISAHSFSHKSTYLLSCSLGSEAVKIELEESDFRILSLICRLLYAEISYRLSNEFDKKLQQISWHLLLFELNLIHAKYLSLSGTNFTRSETLVSKFLSVLSIHCRKHHNVNFYAGVLYVSPEYLSKMVKYKIGKSAKVLIKEAVLSEALALLENQDYTIGEISEELEFSSVTSFSIFFKKAMACTPTQYRKNAAERFKSR